MSTDDLTRRAKTYAEAFSGSTDAALVSELADKVDRLRAERDRAYKAGLQDRDAEWDRQQDYYEVSLAAQERALIAERDAARAALGRVWDVLDDYLGDHVTNAHTLVLHAARAIEGKS